MNLIKLLPDFLKSGFSIIDKMVPDKDMAARLKAGLQERADEHQADVLAAQTEIIVAEAKSGSWLTQNWRPLVMIDFALLVTAHWLGYTPENLDPAQVEMLLKIVQVGLGGYVVGRSAEKVANAWRQQAD